MILYFRVHNHLSKCFITHYESEVSNSNYTFYFIMNNSYYTCLAFEWFSGTVYCVPNDHFYIQPTFVRCESSKAPEGAGRAWRVIDDIA